MDSNQPEKGQFSEKYAHFNAVCLSVREFSLQEDAGCSAVSEETLQGIWYDQLFSENDLRTQEGHALTIVSPGWWNRQEGPDFRGAQIEFNGKLFTGDVEIHAHPSEWTAHKHHLDSRYDEVILHVVFDRTNMLVPAFTSEGRAIPTLVLEGRLSAELGALSQLMLLEEYPYWVGQAQGRCAEWAHQAGEAAVRNMLSLAGEWRMLHKARTMRERMERVGADQAVYEAFMYACGFGHFKHHFRAIARHLPYERVRQLAQQDPLLLEAAFLRIAGLLPEALPEGTSAVPHFARLRALRRDHLAGLTSLPLTWRRTGIRPANQPERRLAGAARFLARTARDGLMQTLDRLWREPGTPVQRRRQFETLFPGATGFWANHCTWAGHPMTRPCMLIGGGRIRSIIGNVFIPAALAAARRGRDRVKEEQVHALFQHLPKEPENQIVRLMTPRILGANSTFSLDFCTQQGLLQIFQDWCEGNPSCRNCSMLRHLPTMGGRV